MDFRRMIVAAVKIGVLWGIGWALVSAAIRTILWLNTLAAFAVQAHVTLLGWLASGLFRSFVVGWCAGAGFATLLAVAERNRTVVTLSAVRVALWGALMSGGMEALWLWYFHWTRHSLADPAVLVAIDLGVMAAFGAIAGAVTLVVGRRGTRSAQLADPSQVAMLP